MPSGGDLGIKAGEIWAYRAGQRTPLQPAKVIDPGKHYDAHIRVRLVDDPGLSEIWVKRAKLPCRWHKAGEWLDAHPEAWPAEYREPLPQPAAVDRITITLAALRRVVKEELAAMLDERRLAYSVADFATASGYGRTTIDEAIARGDLLASYANSKGVIDIDEGRRWIKSLPHEPPK